MLAIGKKHEAWVVDGIDRYERRLKKPYDLSWRLLPHSARQEEAART
ncbi:50S rRNA methyltransferase, partial [Xanthomonas citri pv. citri]|nr:50S rRNA methyltransferase [Xanthomonas citri pv. citri]